MKKITFVMLFLLIAFSLQPKNLLAASVPEILNGHLDGITTDSSGNSYVSGWACAEGNPAALVINVYADGPYPIGTQVNVIGYLANQPSSPAAIAACGKAGAHNFSIQLTSESFFKQGKQPLYVYAVSPTQQSSLLLAGSGSTLIPAYDPAPANPRTCIVSNGDPNHCFTSIANYDVLSFAGDYTCMSADSCCPGGNALISMNKGVNNKVIEGNGHTLRRENGQRNCPAIQITSSNEILVDNLNLDENNQAPPCDVYSPSPYGKPVTPCANTIQAVSDTDLKLSDVNIYYGKGYVVSVIDTDGFAFAHSTISEAGIIGLYVGYPDGKQNSQNVAITDSVIARSRTNGIAIQGAKSDNVNDPILITNNILTQNHWHGLWPAGAPYPETAVSEGGEMLIATARNIRISNNIIADAWCQNGYDAQTNEDSGGPVSAVEMGQAGTYGVVGAVIENNYFYNGAQMFAIYQNPGSIITSPQIENNRVAGWTGLTNISTGTIAGNDVGDTSPSLAQNGTALYHVLRETKNVHWEAKEPGELAGSTIESTFGLSPSPRPGASAAPLVRCFSNGDPNDDYLSYDRSCGGAGALHSVVGYSFEATDSKARPFYLCNVNNANDQFISWDNQCEGQTKLLPSPLGYAQVEP